MGRSIFAAVLVAGVGLLGAQAVASAQQTEQTYAPPVLGGESPQAASPSGAAYIPGVGFRFVPPPGVYGYRAYAPRVYGYRAYRRGCDASRDWWGWDRCARHWR